MGQHAGLRRALELYRLNLRTEANREWLWAIRGFDDRQLLAAAEVARRNEIYDRAINTADRTVGLHDFSLRYLAPYRDVLKSHTAQLALDEAWVYGLIRQESRFIADAKSRAGASGLMQLMPGTARWVAKKLGLKDWRWSQVTEVDTNVSLGTYYLQARARHARRPAGARFGRLQRRAGPRARLAPGSRDGRRDLRRDHPVQRDARLREEGDGERDLLRAHLQPAGAVAQAAPGHGRPRGSATRERRWATRPELVTSER